jgi:hypothetical protein
MGSDSSRTSPESGQRFRTLQLAASTTYDAAALGRAMSRAAATDKGASKRVVIYGPSGEAHADAWVRYQWTVWWERPALWRDDLTWANRETTVIIVRPDAALAYVSMQRTLYTSERPDATDKRPRVSPAAGMQLPTLDQRLIEFPLIRPRLPASDWQLTLIGQELYLGRAARRVRATRRVDSVRTWDPRQSGFWEGVDEYECVIDDELQISLSVTGSVDGVAVATISVEQVNVDSPLPASAFHFSPPAGTRVAHIARDK